MTYRDGLIFCSVYPLLIWGFLVVLNHIFVNLFSVDAEGVIILWAFTHIGAAAFTLTGMSFVAPAAFNNLGRPMYSTVINWVWEGVFSLPLTRWFAALYRALGVVYAQAAVAVLIGVPTTLWGLRFVINAAPHDTHLHPPET